MKRLIVKIKAIFIVWIKKQWKKYCCKHPIKTIKYTDFQERYYRCTCDNCGTEIWEDF